jgi:hypothetical protein
VLIRHFNVDLGEFRSSNGIRSPVGPTVWSAKTRASVTADCSST